MRRIAVSLTGRSASLVPVSRAVSTLTGLGRMDLKCWRRDPETCSMSPRSLTFPRSFFGSLTFVGVLIMAAVGLAFYSHVADAHNRLKSNPAARIADWRPPAGLTDVVNPVGCATGALSRCLTSTANARDTATSVAASLGVQPAAISCQAVRGTLQACNFEASIGSTSLVVVVTDRAFFVPAVTEPAKPAPGADVVGSVVDLAVPGSA
jgi:hypothetical protein